MGRTEPDLKSRSSWASLNGVQEVELHPPHAPPDGAAISVPGSKSYTNRALILAALAEGTSVIRNMLRSDDGFWCMEALRNLGIEMTLADDTATIHGCGGDWPNKDANIYLGAAGTLARFLPGALAASRGGLWRLEGTERLNERPIRPLVNALNEMGGRIHYTAEEGKLPITIQARGLAGGSVGISGAVSSQFLSGLLMAAPYAEHAVRIRVEDSVVQPSYVEMTLELLRHFGVSVDYDERFEQYIVFPQRYTARNLSLEADASTSCYFLAYAALTGGHLRVSNLFADTRQPDIGMLNIFERMGCAVARSGKGIELRGSARLKGGFSVSMREMSDQTMTLAAMAPFVDGPITITGVAHIREHECDRIRAMCEALALLGIRTEEREDGLTVYPGKPKPDRRLSTYDDHRMAMSLALIGSKVGGIRLQDPGCVSKTCPTFFDDMRKLGLQMKFINLKAGVV